MAGDVGLLYLIGTELNCISDLGLVSLDSLSRLGLGHLGIQSQTVSIQLLDLTLVILFFYRKNPTTMQLQY